MYESPIDKIYGDIKSQIIKRDEENMMYSIEQAIGYRVDKSELIKALQYDRDQYQKGYNDAMKIVEELKRIAYNDGLINYDGEPINPLEDYSNFEMEVISRLFNR